MPDMLAARMKAVIPSRQRSKILTKLLEDEVARTEAELYKCAHKVEDDKALNEDMKAWDITAGDGLMLTW